jgi:uncharacterized membrane protein YfcA
MHTILKTPLRCAIGTSTFLIGATASASALLVSGTGQTAGGLCGSRNAGHRDWRAGLGVKFAQRIPTLALRLIFVGVMLYTVVRLALK